jgi:hypothetical protein
MITIYLFGTTTTKASITEKMDRQLYLLGETNTGGLMASYIEKEDRLYHLVMEEKSGGLTVSYIGKMGLL